MPDGLTISVPANRDTVLGGAPDDGECYLELVQPGTCGMPLLLRVCSPPLGCNREACSLPRAGKLAVRVTHLTPSIPKTTVPHRVRLAWWGRVLVGDERTPQVPFSLCVGVGVTVTVLRAVGRAPLHVP